MSALAGSNSVVEDDEGLESSKDRIIQSIYDHLLRSVVVGYASNMHEMIKTGNISASEIQTPSSRQEIFPSLYQTKSTEEIQSELDLYATEIPNRQSSRKRKLRQTPPLVTHGTDVDLLDDEHKGEEKEAEDDEDDDDEDFKDEQPDDEDGDHNDNGGTKAKLNTSKAPETPTTAATAINPSLEQQQPPPGVDIWGRIPPKEPKHPVECALCGRHVSTTRFASHLEKCMGLSTRPGIPNRSVSAQNSIK